MPNVQLNSSEIKYPKGKEVYGANVGAMAADWPWANDLNNGVDGPVQILGSLSSSFTKHLSKNLDDTLGLTLISVNNAGTSGFQSTMRRSFYITSLTPDGDGVMLIYTIRVRDTVNISGVTCLKASTRAPTITDGTTGIYWMYLKTAE